MNNITIKIMNYFLNIDFASIIFSLLVIYLCYLIINECKKLYNLPEYEINYNNINNENRIRNSIDLAKRKKDRDYYNLLKSPYVKKFEARSKKNEDYINQDRKGAKKNKNNNTNNNFPSKSNIYIKKFFGSKEEYNLVINNIEINPIIIRQENYNKNINNYINNLDVIREDSSMNNRIISQTNEDDSFWDKKFHTPERKKKNIKKKYGLDKGENKKIYFDYLRNIFGPILKPKNEKYKIKSSLFKEDKENKRPNKINK
jgi:hypothetical protein